MYTAIFVVVMLFHKISQRYTLAFLFKRYTYIHLISTCAKSKDLTLFPYMQRPLKKKQSYKNIFTSICLYTINRHSHKRAPVIYARNVNSRRTAYKSHTQPRSRNLLAPRQYFYYSNHNQTQFSTRHFFSFLPCSSEKSTF